MTLYLNTVDSLVKNNHWGAKQKKICADETADKTFGRYCFLPCCTTIIDRRN